MSIAKWCYVITGFLQHSGTRTRQIDTWAALHRAGGPEFRAELRPWNSNWDAEAEFIFRMSPSYDQPKIAIFGYSWGAGWGAVQLCKALEARGVKVANLVLADPVYRHAYWAGNWRAFVPWVPITIPCNVGEVDWLRQTTTHPMGHDLRAACASTRINPARHLSVSHVHMDEQPEFIAACDRVSRKVFGLQIAPSAESRSDEDG